MIRNGIVIWSERSFHSAMPNDPRFSFVIPSEPRFSFVIPSEPSFPFVIPSERSESRNLHVVESRSLRRDFHAEAQRSAEAQRTTLGVEILARYNAPLQPRLQRQDPWGSAFSQSCRRVFLSPPQAPRLRVRCSSQEQRQQLFTRRRGDAENGSPGRDGDAVRSSSPSTTPRVEPRGRHPAVLGAAVFQGPLRLRVPPRLRVKTRCATRLPGPPLGKSQVKDVPPGTRSMTVVSRPPTSSAPWLLPRSRRRSRSSP